MAHENANIIVGAVQDDAMKESVKITIIAAGFREAARRQPHQRPSYLPKTWKASREPHSVAEEVAPNVSKVIHEVPADDSTCLRFSAAKRKRHRSRLLLRMGTAWFGFAHHKWRALTISSLPFRPAQK